MHDFVAFVPKMKPDELGFSQFVQITSFRSVLGVGDARKNRGLLKRGVEILLSPERGSTKDALRWKHSGLDEASATDLQRWHIAVGFAVHELVIERDHHRRALLMGKMMQNVKICRAYKIPMILCSLAQNRWQLCSCEDLRSLGRLLGMTGAEVNAALNFTRPEKGIREVF